MNLHLKQLISQGLDQQLFAALQTHQSNLDAFDDHEMSLLHLCIKKSRLLALMMLIDKGAPLHLFSKKYGSLLYYSLVCDEVGIYLYLKEKRLGFHPSDQHRAINQLWRWPDFFVAAMTGSLNIMVKIFELNPQIINDTDSFHQNALIWAVSSHHIRVVHFLLSNGISLNNSTHVENFDTSTDHDRSNHGKSALYYAFEEEALGIIQLLMNAGAAFIPLPQEQRDQYHCLHFAAKKNQLCSIIF